MPIIARPPVDGSHPMLSSTVQYYLTLLQSCFTNTHMYGFDFGAKVDRGLVRKTNEDVARVHPDLGLVIVADGMGGHERGEVASELAAESLEACFARLGGVGADTAEAQSHLVEAFLEANARVRSQSSASRAARMGTTLLAVAFGHGHAVVAHVGDSRCYRVRAGSAECLTLDHSYAAELRRQAREGQAELLAAADHYQSVLTRSIGSADDVTVDTHLVRGEPGDIFVLCTDGLWGGVKAEAIERIRSTAARNAEIACNNLISAAWQAGGLDNIGVAVVRLVPFTLRVEPRRSSSSAELAPPGV